MKIFLTGATGYVGSVVAEKLQAAGHDVTALARSDRAAEALASRQLEVVRGDLGDAATLAQAARNAEGVVHTAFDLGSGDFNAAVETETRAVHAMLSGLQGSNKPFILTSGTAVLGDTGTLVYDEDTPIVQKAPEGAAGTAGLNALHARIAVEQAVRTATGVRGIVLRPPNIYGRADGRSVLAILRAAAVPLGAVPYARSTADHRWSFVQVDDLADLYVLALAKAGAGELFHAGAETGLRTQAIAEALSHGLRLGGKTVELDLPALGQALGFPPLAHYWASNSQSSSEKARRVLGWAPTRLDMLHHISTPASAST